MGHKRQGPGLHVDHILHKLLPAGCFRARLLLSFQWIGLGVGFVTPGSACRRLASATKGGSLVQASILSVQAAAKQPRLSVPHAAVCLS